MQARDADNGIGLVNAPISGHPKMKLGQARAVTQGRLAIITGARINFVEFHSYSPFFRMEALAFHLSPEELTMSRSDFPQCVQERTTGMIWSSNPPTAPG